MFIENTDYEILTPAGWKDFRGITVTENKKTVTLTFSNNFEITCTPNHHFFINDEKKYAKDLNIGDIIDTKMGDGSILDIIYNDDEIDVYDIVEVNHETHQFLISRCFITKNCDELAFIEPNITSQFWNSISPTLATGGKAIITSTPNTDEDLFATIWKEANNKFDEFGNETELGINGFFPYLADWRAHPERDEKWAAQERAKLSDAEFEREYECKFISFEETLINPIFLSEMRGINPKLNMGQSRWYKDPCKDHTYVVSLDPSLGTGGNSAAIQVFELPSFEQVAEWNHNLTPIQGQIKIMKEILTYISDCIGTENNNNIYWSIENNTIGEAGLVCIKEVGEESFPGLFLCEPSQKGHTRRFRRGFNTTHKSKITAASRMKYLIESSKLKIYSKKLISELKTYIATGVSFKAKQGNEDDLVAALLLIMRMSKVISDWDPEIFETYSTRSNFSEEEFDFPMPIFMSRYSA